MKLDRDNTRGLLGVLLAFSIIASIDFLKPGVASAPDFSCEKGSTSEVLIDISQGESGSSIAQELEEKGVVQSSLAFYRVAVSNPSAGSIAPGIHRVQRELCAVQALDQLLDRSRIENLISIPEGSWNSEIFSRLQDLGYSQREVEEAARSLQLPAGYTSLEGLLFPAQYSFDSATSVNEILGSILARGISEIKKAKFYESKADFSGQQLVTIASLVQAEGDPQDYRKISQVVRNRLKKGMPLQFDSTVHYIKKTRGSIFLSTQSTLINSPYNTYRRTGLPPTPINNPGAEALFAAGHPENGAWLYFITVEPGDTRFTDSYQQFTDWKILYKKNLRAGKFGSAK